MTSFTVGQLEMATDVIAICFFGITALLLIIMTIKYGRPSPKQVAATDLGGFNEELVHMIKQSEKRNENIGAFDEQATGRHKNVEKLANSGLSAGEISQKVSIPKSEIELILRLKKLGLESSMKNR